jgi:peptidoglycan/LPS O-acetylase OafA/YrhL
MKSFSLRRITSGGAFIPELDGIRFILTGIVVVVHLQLFLMMRFGFSDPGDSFTRLLTQNGVRALPFFFAMSGFMLGLPWASHYLRGGRAVPLKHYYLRRVTRLEPPYVASMLMMFVIFSLSQHHGYSTWFWFERLCVSLLYLHTIVFGQSSILNPAAWSLEIEIQFYCLAPLLALVFAVQNRLKRRGLLIGIILCAGLASLLWSDSLRMHDSIASFLQFFLAGMLFADIFVTDWHETRGQHWLWDVVGLMVGLLAFCVDAKWFAVVGPFLILVAYASVFRGIWLGSLLRQPFMTLFGGMCYSIYLIHLQVMAKALVFSSRLFQHAPHYLYFLLQIAMMAIVVGVCSTIFYLLIERPCMKRDWPQQLWSRIQNRNIKGHSSPSIQEDPIHSREMEASSLS